MKCHEARRHLDLFMDGELSVQENMKVLEHLNLCRDCAGVYEGEKVLRRELKSRVGSDRAPEGLVDRLLGRLGGAVSEFPHRRPWGSGLAAAAFFVALVGMLIFTPAPVLPSALAVEMAERHDATREGFGHRQHPDGTCVCAKCCPDELLRDRIGAFFDGHGLDQVCHHPELEKMGYRFSGVAVWSLPAGKVFWTVRRRDGAAAITHGLVSMPLATTTPMSTVECNGRVVFFKPRMDRPGVTCVFIFDDASQLDDFRRLLTSP